MAALLGCVALGACAAGSSTKAGGAVDEVVTLRIGTDEFPSRIGADQIDHYARRVHELSAGTMRIEPVWRAAGDGVRQWDQRVARMVVSGELDMGLIPARAWDTEGVLSMRALHAPFLVTSSELLEEILSGGTTEVMLASLDTIGLTGLAILPESLRYALSFGPALTSPEAFDGLTVRGPWSATSFATFEALGATFDDVNGAEFAVAVADSTVGAAEAALDFRTEGGTGNQPMAVVGDLVLWPKVNTLVVNAERFEQLSLRQQEWLRQAAADAVHEAWSEYKEDDLRPADLCERGSKVVVVGDDVRERFLEAVAPVYQDLERDELTARLIADIRDLADQMRVDPSSTVVPCQPAGATSVDDDAVPTSPAEAADDPPVTSDDPPVTSVDPPATSDGPPDLALDPPDPALDGVYRVEWTESWLRETIEPHVDRTTLLNLLHHDVGVWQLTLDGGRFEISKVGSAAVCNGSYTTRDGRILVMAATEWQALCGNTVDDRFLVDARYEVDRSELRLSDFQLSEEVDHTWWYALLGFIPPQRTA